MAKVKMLYHDQIVRGDTSMSTGMEILEQPELKYTKTGLAVCTIRHEGIRYVAFGKCAEELAQSVKVGDVLQLFGRYKTYDWKDRNGIQRSRKDFIIKRWERSR